jgi:glycyl-tRNA synthetase beta subunit
VRTLPETYELAPEYYTEDATRALYAAWEQHAPQVDRSVEELCKALNALQGPINRFFTDVLVMAEDPELRRARLALVQRVAALSDGVADLSQLQGF